MEAARQSPYSGLPKGVANGHGGTSPGYFLGPTLQTSQHPEKSREADIFWLSFLPQAGCGPGHTPFHGNSGARCPEKELLLPPDLGHKRPCCWCHQKVIHSFSQNLLGPHCVAGHGPATGRTAVRGRESRFLRAPCPICVFRKLFPKLLPDSLSYLSAPALPSS